MARDIYYVVHHQGKWKIKYEDEHFGNFPSQQAAIRKAVDAANQIAQTHSDGAQVVVQGEDNKFRTEWTYGNDPYPPKG